MQEPGAGSGGRFTPKSPPIVKAPKPAKPIKPPKPTKPRPAINVHRP